MARFKGVPADVVVPRGPRLDAITVRATVETETLTSFRPGNGSLADVLRRRLDFDGR